MLGVTVDAAGRRRYRVKRMQISVELDAIRARLSGRLQQRQPGPVLRRGAIAAVLRVGPLDTELLLIRRAERDGDPWSGHMALPGGHQHPSDEDMLATAIRERPSTSMNPTAAATLPIRRFSTSLRRNGRP